ncbi:MAG: DHH family phosphoesterase [Clostridia bacterium]|nr:DHH family phosphoesterase [Clostridia bacterium]
MRKTAEFLKENDNYLILTHRRPDGDTCGSAAALCVALREMGKRAFLAENEDITKKLAPYVSGLSAPDGFTPDKIIAVDIADEKLFLKSCERFRGKVDLCIDHHPTNTRYAKELLLRDEEAAVGVVIYDLAKELGVTLPLRFYESVYLAVSTDTGCFKYANTTPKAHETAAACMAAGVDFHRINTAFFIAKTGARIRLERELFDKMIISADGRICGTVITRDLIDEIHADNDDLDNLSSLLMQLESAFCGVLLTENKQRGEFKVSVRTRAPVSASRICAAFGGGGHDRAAGANISGEPHACLEKFMKEAEKEVLCTTGS